MHNETVDYLCERGYSVDEEPQGNTNGRFEVRCSHTGSYVRVRSGAEQCLLVVCADVPDGSDALRQDELHKMVFNSEASWQCNPGFSTDKVVGGNRAVTAHCRWNGTFPVQAERHNRNDCSGNLCGPHGVCRDSSTPTGCHSDDQTESEFGFELKNITQNGTTYRTCANIVVCPDAGACVPGTCAEKIGEYSCSCHPLYEEGSSAAYKHDCNRKRCGMPIAIDNADHVSSVNRSPHTSLFLIFNDVSHCQHFPTLTVVFSSASSHILVSDLRALFTHPSHTWWLKVH